MITPPPSTPPPDTASAPPPSTGAANSDAKPAPVPRPSLWDAATSALNGGWMKLQKWLPYNVVAPPLVLAFVLSLSQLNLFVGFEAQTLDARYQFRAGQDPEFDSRLVLGAIDERTLSGLGSWPISRQYYAKLLKYLPVERPKVVALDIFLDRPSPSPEDDEMLVSEAVNYPGFLTGAVSDKRVAAMGTWHGSGVGMAPSGGEITKKIDEMYLFGQTANMPKIVGGIHNIDGSVIATLPFHELSNVSGFGFVDSDPGFADPARRNLPMMTRVGDKVFPSLVLNMLATYWDVPVGDIDIELGKEIRLKEGSDSTGNPGLIHRIPINEKGELYINYRQQVVRENAPVSVSLSIIYDLARKFTLNPTDNPFPEAYQRHFLRPLRDNILIIGLTAVGTSDLGITPFSSKAPLVDVHLNAINTILRGDYVRTVPLWIECLIWLLLCTSVLYLLDRRRLRVAVTVPFLIIGSYLVFCLVVFASHSLILPVVWPVLGFGAVCVGSGYLRWQAEQQEKQRIAKIFSSYVSPGVMEKVMSNPDNVKLGGDSRRVTIMFSDIRGFTTFSEAMGDEALVTQLNEYFDKMVGCVIQYNGTLHKFIGDAIMAVWGDVVSESPEADARNAVRSALAMRRALRELNAFWKADGRMTQAIGIGINHGTVRVGNIGAPTRMEFTVIGDPVNFASRLEGVTKEFRTDFLIGESVKPLLGEGFLLRTAGKILVKGKTEAITVYEVIAELGDPVHAEQQPWVATYEAAFAAFQTRRFSEALTGFESCLAFPGREKDFCCQQYSEACRDYIAEPPDAAWTGVYVMKTK